MSVVSSKTREIERIKNLLRANYHKTALGKGSGTSRPTRLFLKWLTKNTDRKISKVLDLGAGKGRDENTCRDNHFFYTGYDPHRDFGYDQPDYVLGEQYDLILCNYVLNVIIPEDRQQVIHALITHLQKGTMIVLGVRQDKYEVKDNWKPFENGFITTKTTFQHFFTIQEVRKIFSRYSKIIKLDSRGSYLLLPKEVT
jgi:hypothetical protein